MVPGVMPEEPATAVVVTAPAGAHPDARDVEMVERKGRGHPDSICDGLAEAFSIGLTRAYYERCGAILHHNVDKVLLAAGSSNPRFGGGEVTAPLEVFLAGRATSMADGIVIPVSEIADQTSRTWFRANLHALDLGRHVRIRSLVRPGSTALAGLMPRGQAAGFVANDTSFAVGHAPPSRLERVVLAVEQALTSPATIAAHPMIGEDVKVMGLRRGHEIDLTIAVAFVDRHISTQADYIEAKALVSRLAEHATCEIHHHHVRVSVNTADDLANGRVYLTVTGTSAEAGDDGEAGRGNRVGGLITPCRPMTLEAAAGKNAAMHVGKSYSIVAHRIARALMERCPDVADATCVLVSRIGSPVETPQLVEMQLRTRDDLPLDSLRAPAESIARDCLHELSELPQILLARASVESPAAWPGVLLF
jgi:S-adenosylmethionine synthetase